VIGDVVHNYNNRIHSTTGFTPSKMNRDNIKSLNYKLRLENAKSKIEMRKFKVGDLVRYLMEKTVFEKGGRRFSNSVWTVIGSKGYNIKIKRNDNIKYKKHWELLKINL